MQHAGAGHRAADRRHGVGQIECGAGSRLQELAGLGGAAGRFGHDGHLFTDFGGPRHFAGGYRPFGGHGAFADGTRGLNAGIRALAKERRVPCVDLEKEFAGAPEQTSVSACG